MTSKKLSKGRVSEHISREEEEKKAKRNAMDQLELRRLTRQTRMMKQAKLKDGAVEKNTKVKQILIKEKDDLEDSLNLMKSKSRCMSDTKQAQNIVNLFSQGDDLDEAIAQEKKYIQDLESQIQKDSKNIYILKKKKGNDAGTSDYFQKKENERADRTLESWKSRLTAEQKQLALITKENEEMRKKLHRLLAEKGKFNQLFGELMAKLSKGKRIMADIVEQARQEFQKRDEVSRKIDALRSRDKADLAKRMEEMQDLEKRLYEDQKLAEFRHRVQIVREKLEHGVRASIKDSLEQEKLGKKVEKAHEFWDQLKEATGQTTADEIAKYFINEDSRLFSLFNFNNEIRDQLEVLSQKTAELVRTVDEEQITAENHQDQVARVRNTLQKKLEMLEQDYNDMCDHSDANARLFSRLLAKIKVLFDLMKCNNSVLQDLLGNNKEVTEFNYNLYLGLIETEVINVLEFLNSCLRATPSIRSKITISAIKTKSTIVTLKTVKSTMSATAIQDRRIITIACVECEGMPRAKFL